MMTAVREALSLHGSTGAPAESDSASRGETERVVVGVAPAGPWSDQLLLDTAALLGRLASVTLDRPPSGRDDLSVLALGNGPSAEPCPAELDVLLLTHPSPLVASLGLLGSRRRRRVPQRARGPGV